MGLVGEDVAFTGVVASGFAGTFIYSFVVAPELLLSKSGTEREDYSSKHS